MKFAAERTFASRPDDAPAEADFRRRLDAPTAAGSARDAGRRPANWQWSSRCHNRHVPGELRALAVATMWLASSAFSGEAERIVGSWKLVSAVYGDVATMEPRQSPMERRDGYQIATPEALWVALVTAENRPVQRTIDERARKLQTMIS